MSFYLKAYEALLRAIVFEAPRPVYQVRDAAAELREKGGLGACAILRHDVDRRPRFAERMAERERALGIGSTYYFRCNSEGRFPAISIRLIAGLGHEVGFHYENLSRCGGDRKAALRQFEFNLAAFREIAECTTVAMHGAPFSPHSNQELLVGEDLCRFGLEADAVLSFNHLKLAYLTDTGGRWQAGQVHNLRDRVGMSAGEHPSPDEPEFTVWLSNLPHPVYVSTHPERWADNVVRFVEATLRDAATNQAKRLMRLAHTRLR